MEFIKMVQYIEKLETKIDTQQQEIETIKFLQESTSTELETKIDVQQKELESINKQIEENTSTISSLRCDLLDIQLKCYMFEDFINKLVRDIEDELMSIERQLERLRHSPYGTHPVEFNLSAERDRLTKQKEVYVTFIKTNIKSSLCNEQPSKSTYNQLTDCNSHMPSNHCILSCYSSTLFFSKIDNIHV